MTLLEYCDKDPVEWLEDIDKAKASGKGVSIVEVAERCQDPRAAGVNIRPSSPRTAEAFLRSGFDPEDLVFKPEAFFKERTGDDELAGLAFTFFEEGRTKRIDELRTLRQALIDDGWKPGDVARPAGGAAAGGEGTEGLVEREQKRLEVLRNRQKRELEQLVDYEVKRAQMQAKAEAKLAKQEERAAEQQRQKDAKEKAWRDALREQELKRLAAERDEEAALKTAEKERFKREQDQLARERAREVEARKAAYRKEQERIAKAEAGRMETEKILEQQQRLVEARKREMARRDSERAAIKAEKQRTLAEENEEKRRQAAARLKAAYDTNVALLENKRQAFYRRERENEERRRKQAEEREAEDARKRAAASAKAEKRKDVYKQAVKKQQDTVEGILKKAADQEESMAREAERQAKALARKKLLRQLNMEYRMECVDTSRKAQLYQREQLLHKIEAETERVVGMQRSRAALQMQRKEANMQAAMQRQKMVETMDKLQATKKFDKIASGEVSIESLVR